MKVAARRRGNVQTSCGALKFMRSVCKSDILSDYWCLFCRQYRVCLVASSICLCISSIFRPTNIAGFNYNLQTSFNKLSLCPPATTDKQTVKTYVPEKFIASAVSFRPFSIRCALIVSHAEMKSMHRIGTQISKFDLFQIVDGEYMRAVFCCCCCCCVCVSFERVLDRRVCEVCKTLFLGVWNYAERNVCGCICAPEELVQPTNSIVSTIPPAATPAQGITTQSQPYGQHAVTMAQH